MARSACGRASYRSDITPSDLSGTGTQGASLTSAAFSRSGNKVVLAFNAGSGSFALISDSRLFPWSPRVWRRYRALGEILSVQFAARGEGFTALERWGSDIVKVHYPIDRSDVVDALKQD